MTKMICLECGYNFDTNSSKECPICKNNSENKLLESIEFSKYDMHKLGICKDENLRKEIKRMLDNKGHSVAYIMVCARDLERKGYMHLAMALDEIAKRKRKIEADLLEAFGIKDDMRININNILKKAEDDVIHCNKIAAVAKNNDDAVHDLMHEMAKYEAENLAAINGILRRYMIESSEKIDKII